MKSRKSLYCFEICVVISQFLIILLSFLIQFIPGFRSSLKGFIITLLNTAPRGIDGSIAGIFLQIDATILTLSIALIAMISGFLSESHMGISLSDYYLNIRPRIFKQIVIIILSLIYFAVGCISFWLELYYIVAAILFCQILLILMSTISLYGIFRGNEKVRQEIEDYSVEIQTEAGHSCSMRKICMRLNIKLCKKCGDNNKDTGKQKDDVNKGDKKNIVQQDVFVDAFINVLSRGDKTEFDVYLNAFLRITEYVWINRNDDNSAYKWETYRKNCCRLLDACADSDEHQSKILYLRLADSIYEYLFGLIRAKKVSLESNSKQRHSFDVIEFYSFGNDILRKISITDLENTVRLPTLLYRMRVVEIVLFRDYDSAHGETNVGLENTKSRNRWIPNSLYFSIYSAMGQYIEEQQRKGNHPNISYWTRIFDSWHGISHIDYLSDEDKRALSRAVSACGVAYTCGLLIHAQFEIIKKGLYDYRLSSLHPFEEDEKRTVLSIHAFLYYMAYCENEDAVGRELRRMVLDFLKDPDVIGAYREFITQQNVSRVLIDNLRSKWRREGENRVNDDDSRLINAILRPFDLRMGGRGMQRLIMSEVIDDFCIFTLMFLSHHSLADLEWLGDEYHNIEDFTTYISNGNDFGERMVDFIRFVNADILKNEKPGSDKVVKYENLGIILSEKLQSVIKERYKVKKVKEAREKEAEYLRNHDLIEDKKIGWVRDIQSNLKERFGTIIKSYPSGGAQVRFIRVELFSYETYTNMIDDKFDITDLDRIATRVIDFFIRLMKENGCIECKDRNNDFFDDHAYANYLRDNKLEVMLGSELLLKNKDYRESEEFNEITRDFKWIKTYGGFYGAAIKKGSVVLYIKKIEANISEVSLDDEYEDSSLSKFEYEPIVGISIPFERDELLEFLKNERKKVNVTAEIGIQVYDEDAGIFFESKRDTVETMSKSI